MTLHTDLQLLYSDTRLDAVLEALDTLHSAASEGTLSQATTLTETELKGWLIDLIYTARETLVEIDSHHQVEQEPALSLVRKTS